jgi:hypothetical protein
MIEDNKERVEANMDIPLNSIQGRMEAAITSIRSESEESINKQVECILGPVSLNEHGYQQNVATVQDVDNIAATATTPTVANGAARRQHKQEQDGDDELMW